MTRIHIPTSVSVTAISVLLVVIILRRLMMNAVHRVVGRWVKPVGVGTILVYTPSIPDAEIRWIYMRVVGFAEAEQTFTHPSGVAIQFVYLLPVAPGSWAEGELHRLLMERGGSALQIDGVKHEVDDQVNLLSAEEAWRHAKIVHPSRVETWRPQVRWDGVHDQVP